MDEYFSISLFLFGVFGAFLILSILVVEETRTKVGRVGYLIFPLSIFVYALGAYVLDAPLLPSSIIPAEVGEGILGGLEFESTSFLLMTTVERMIPLSVFNFFFSFIFRTYVPASR